jgi:hypothetical protein
MAVLDLAACPICQARDSLERQTTQLESRTHVTYECLECGTSLVWLGDDMWLEADRWSFQKVGRPERADLLYRSLTVAELRTLTGEKPPYTAAPGKATRQAIPPPTWIEMTPTEEDRFEEALPEEAEEMRPAEVAPAAAEEAQQAAAQPEVDVGAAVIGAALLAQEPVQQAAAQEPQPQVGAEAAVVGAALLAQEPAQQAAAQQAAAQQAAAQERQPEAGVEAAVVGAAALAQEEAQHSTAQAETPAPDDAPSAGPPPARSSQQLRRGRGSPFLVISVGLVLLCLICAAAAMVIYSMVENFPAGLGPTTNPPASEVLPTNTAAPSPTPSPMPTEEAPPETAGGVEFQGVTDYVSGTGSHYLVGEVLNKTADTLRFIEVLATFYDADGQLVGTGSTFTELSIIEPGSTAPFKLTTLDPPALGHYDLRVDYSTTTQPPIRLEIVGHSGSAADTGWYHVTGEVRNPHNFTIKFPEIVATYYNATHDVVRVEVDFAKVDPLEPGQSAPFEVVLTDPPAGLQHYILQTEAVQP